MYTRVPLPAKLLLSYLLVVATGAVPTVAYLRAELKRQLEDEAYARLARQALAVGRALGGLSLPEQQAEARLYAILLDAQVSLILETGEVLYDSHALNPLLLESHAERLEVRLALERLAPLKSAPSALREGVGVSRRTSNTTGLEMLYVAALVPTEQTPAQVVRLAVPLARVHALVAETVAVLRNAQAVAVSLSLGLSLLAAVLFVRPLRRIQAAALALASGDFARKVGALREDEVGDVGRAIERLGAELRRRMAVASVGEALLVQLIDVMPEPLMAFELDGEVVAISGAARRCFQFEDPEAGRRLRELLESDAFQAALQRAEDESEPEEVEVPLRAEATHGFVHVLKRPGTAPLGLLLLPRALADEASGPLPRAAEVRARPFDEVLREACSMSETWLSERGISLDVPAALPSLSVADAGERLPRALGEAFVGVGGWFAGRAGSLTLDVEVAAARIGVTMDAVPDGEALAEARAGIEPLGGVVDVTIDEVTLWLPRA